MGKKQVNNQDGIALLTVLLATALVAILAVGMTFAQHIDIRRTTNLLNGDQAMVLALGLEQWANQVLIRDSEDGSVDHLGEDWAQGLMPMAADNGIIAGEIVDLQGKINLNNLVAGDQLTIDRTELILQRLFEFCEVDDSHGLVQALGDWLDTDEEVREDGAEDNEYLLYEPAYLSANRLMVSPTELLLVKGAKPEDYSCLAANITTLSGATAININTAGVEVIAALADNISIAAAEEIVKDRPDSGYGSISDFLAHPGLAGSGLTSDGLALGSNYFMTAGQAVYGEAEVRLYTVVTRNSGSLTVLARSIGAY